MFYTHILDDENTRIYLSGRVDDDDYSFSIYSFLYPPHSTHTHQTHTYRTKPVSQYRNVYTTCNKIYNILEVELRQRDINFLV